MEEFPTSEDRLLGGILFGLSTRNPAVETATSALEPRHFASEANRAVFRAVAALRRAGTPVDLLAVHHWLRSAGPIGEVAEPAHLACLWVEACDPGEVGDLAEALIREDRPEPPPRQVAREPDLPPTQEPVYDTSFDFGANAPPDTAE